MLVLTRRLDESIVIGGNIEIKVLKISGNQVHLGIDAPRDIALYRKEIYEQVVSENQRAQGPANLAAISGSLGELNRLLQGNPRRPSSAPASDDRRPTVP